MSLPYNLGTKSALVSALEREIETLKEKLKGKFRLSSDRSLISEALTRAENSLKEIKGK